MLMVVAIQCVSGQSAADGLTECFPSFCFYQTRVRLFFIRPKFDDFFISHLVTVDKWIIWFGAPRVYQHRCQHLFRILYVYWWGCNPPTSHKAWNLSNKNNQDILCQFFTENWFPFFLWITWHKSSLKNFPGFCVPPILKSHLTDLMNPRGNSSLLLLLILSVQSRAFLWFFRCDFLSLSFLSYQVKNCCKLARGWGQGNR